MGRKFLIGNFLLLIGMTVVFGQSHLPQHSIDSITKSKLTAEILQMGKLDQQYRFQLMFGEADATKVDSLLKLPDSTRRKLLLKFDTHPPFHALKRSKING